MKKAIGIFLAIHLVSATTFAECAKPVSYLTEGTKASCSGYLFSPEQEQKVRALAENFDNLSKIVVKQDELIHVLDKRLTLQISVNQNLREQNEFNAKQSYFEKAMWFGLGVVTTGLIVYVRNRN
jgi:hypothetical protein